MSVSMSKQAQAKTAAQFSQPSLTTCFFIPQIQLITETKFLVCACAHALKHGSPSTIHNAWYQPRLQRGCGVQEGVWGHVHKRALNAEVLSSLQQYPDRTLELKECL